MIEGITLGAIQGIAEWLPISSEGMVALFGINLLGWTDLEKIIQYAIFLHLGTFLAALVYFRKDICDIFKSLKKENRNTEDFKIFKFLFISTLITGIIGFLILVFIKNLDNFNFNKLNILIGLALVITGFVQIKKRKTNFRVGGELKLKDGVWLGFVQAFSIIPGLSRSGLTIATLLFRKIEESLVIKLSFLMSLPVVLGANIILNFNNLSFSRESLIAVLFSFVFGILTIHIFLAFAKKVNWPKFVIIFGLIVMVASFI